MMHRKYHNATYAGVMKLSNNACVSNSACVNNRTEEMAFNYTEVLVVLAVLVREGS